MSRVSTLKLAACTVVVAIACAAAVPAGAQGSYSSSSGRSTELTLFNGYYIASDLYSVSDIVSGPTDVKVGLSNSYMWGGRLGFNPNERLGVELAYTRVGSAVTASGDLPRINPLAPASDSDLGRLNGNSYDMNFLFYQDTPNPRAKGFFVLGFGWTMTSPDIKIPAPSPYAGKNVKSNSLFNWNFGVGAKVDLNEKLALRLEGRWRVTDTAITTSAGVYCDYWGYCYSYSSDWYDSGELTAGLTYKIPSR